MYILGVSITYSIRYSMIVANTIELGTVGASSNLFIPSSLQLTFQQLSK